MFCMNCGKELREGAKFCTGCGTPVNGALQNPVTEERDEMEILKEQYEGLAADVETKKAEYELLKKEVQEADKVKLELAILHEEIEDLLKNARFSIPVEKVVEPPKNLKPAAESSTVQKKFCPKCGARVDNARFCGKCGNKMF